MLLIADSAYFELTFDLALRDGEEIRVTGLDAVGPFDDLVKVKRHK